ncbi:MAG: hypothetical protein WAJ85_02535, partial [Candidatus Baltobacteraceae bacterium]
MMRQSHRRKEAGMRRRLSAAYLISIAIHLVAALFFGVRFIVPMSGGPAASSDETFAVTQEQARAAARVERPSATS